MLKNKNEEAYRQIKEDIMDGTFGSDTPISESILVGKFKFSRTPIRAALQRLQQEGFVKIIPNQGVVIKDISIEEANELYDLRILVENYMIDRSFPLLNPVDVQEMYQILEQQKAACDSHDYNLYLQLDHKFHSLTYCRYKNEKMMAIFDHYKERFSRNRALAIQNNGRMANGLSEHYAIVDCLKRGDIEGAKANAKKHINKGAMRALNF